MVFLVILVVLSLSINKKETKNELKENQELTVFLLSFPSLFNQCLLCASIILVTADSELNKKGNNLALRI